MFRLIDIVENLNIGISLNDMFLPRFCFYKLNSCGNKNRHFYVACREWYFIKIEFKPCTISLVLCWPMSVYDD